MQVQTQHNQRWKHLRQNYGAKGINLKLLLHPCLYVNFFFFWYTCFYAVELIKVGVKFYLENLILLSKLTKNEHLPFNNNR